jgi:negative regulator of sigma E activity
MTFDDETLGAYVDGELDQTTVAEIEAAATSDAVLAARIDKARRLKALLGGAFASVATEPTSERFMRVVAGEPSPTSAEIIRFQGKPPIKPKSIKAKATKPTAAKPAAQQAGSGASLWAMAACLAAGVILGVIAPWKTTTETTLSPNRTVTVALDRQASGSGAGPVRIGLSFKAKDGAYCRTFSTGATAGLACREGQTWAVRAAAPAAVVADTAYRTASSETPRAVLDAVDAMIQGAPLDAGAEAKARKAGWK